MLDSETIDDDIPLAALIALYGIDGDIQQSGNPQKLYLMTDHCYLVTIGYDNPYCTVDIKMLTILAPDTFQEVCDKMSLLGIDLVAERSLTRRPHSP